MTKIINNDEHIEKVNVALDNFHKLFYEAEDLALKKGIKCLTHTELHIIEAIGEDTITMNELADRLKITMGTATVAITKLSEKKFVDRLRSNTDRRKVFVSLSKKGLSALTYHNNYHKKILTSITHSIPEEDMIVFIKTFETILSRLKTETYFSKPKPITDFVVGDFVTISEIKGTPIVLKYFASNGIEIFSHVQILKSKNKDEIILKKDDGSEIEVNILDAKNLIVLKADK